MIIVINEKEITINNHRDLNTTVCSLAEADADALMQKVLADPDTFKMVFENSYAFRDGLTILPEKYARQLLRHVLENTDEFNRIISNNFILDSTLANIPAKYVEDLLWYVYADVKHFQHIFDNQIAFTGSVLRLPEKYAQQLVKFVLEQPLELGRLINSKYAFEDMIKKLPDKYKAEIIRRIVSNPAEVARLVDGLDTLKIYLEILPEQFAGELIHNLGEDRKVFERLVNSAYTLQRVIVEFPEQYARQLVQRYDSLNQESALHIAAKFKPEHIPMLLKFGSRPLTESVPELNTLHYLLGNKNCPIECILPMIDQGTDPNTVNRDGCTSLHKAAESSSENANQYVPILIKLGVDVKARNSGGQTALQLLLAKNKFTEKDLDPALALIQHGDNPNAENPGGKNILQLVYQHYPQMRAYVLAKQVEKQEMENPAHVFAKINIASFRLEIQRLSSVHHARKNYVNFLLWLVYHRSHENKGSLFKIAPPALLGRIISFLDFTAMEKTAVQGLALADHVFNQAQIIKSLTHTPGGISVLQQYGENNQPQFTLFQSARTLCRDYNDYKDYLTKTQHRRHPLYDKVTKKEFTNTSLRQIEDYRNNHAAGYLRKHVSLFKNKESKLALIEGVEQTELYNPAEPGPKKK